MQRRPRIKTVANLSTARRVIKQEKKEFTESKKEQITENIQQDQQLSNIDVENNDTSTASAIKGEAVFSHINFVDDVNKNDENVENINEIVDKFESQNQQLATNESINNDKTEKPSESKEDAFKTPQHIPRAENDASTQSTNKFRRPKIMPRLNISRATGSILIKREESDEKNKKNEDEVFEPPQSPQTTNNLPQQNEQRQTESPLIFSPPSTPFSPPSTNRSRCETPREISESPGLIVNHNLHHPSTPQSPFFPIPHSRIRTESICSIKSTTTVANLQPRKKVRTEDQKILDNKRESRERLSNKQIEKSQLRMFDMIYYNPSTNPMKPRETQKEGLPKKIDLTAELPETPVEIEPPTAMAVPQLRLNANGEMVLDESSLVVENEEQRKNRILLANTNVVLHDDSSGSYGYYKRQQRTREWPQEETIKFFRCLNTVGTDFSLMLNLFPNRSRRDLKLKFKKEEKNNPSLVDKALRNHSVFDIEELQRELEEEDEARRKEAESKSSEVKELVKRKILSKQEAKAKSQQNVKSKIEKILNDGDSALNADDKKATQDIKENFQNSTETKASKIKRQTRKRKIKDEICEESIDKKISFMLNSRNSSAPEELSSEFIINNNDMNDDSSDIGLRRNFDTVITKKDERDAEIIHEYIAKVQKMDRDDDAILGSATSEFLSEVVNNTEETNNEEINNVQYLNENQHEDAQEEVENIPCDRIPKHEINKSPIEFIMDHTNLKSEIFERNEYDSYPNNLNDDQQPQSVESQLLDDEAFLNSLDLERLVIVVKQIDGESIYDIHETDATTQTLSEKPLKLPRHIVDLIVSVMTQDD